jgi:hypothetical protein
MLNVIMLNVLMQSIALLNAIKLNVMILNVIMLNVIMLSVAMLNVLMLSIVIPSVVAPAYTDARIFYFDWLAKREVSLHSIKNITVIHSLPQYSNMFCLHWPTLNPTSLIFEG